MKRTFVLALCTIILLGITGCGNDNSTPKKTDEDYLQEAKERVIENNRKDYESNYENTDCYSVTEYSETQVKVHCSYDVYGCVGMPGTFCHKAWRTLDTTVILDK